MRYCRKNLGAIGTDCMLDFNIKFQNPQNIYIGNKIKICGESRFLTWESYAGKKYAPKIVIGDGTRIGYRNSFSSIVAIEIGKNVLFADMVHVTDHSHGYEDINRPIIQQELITKGKIVIEDDCWLGFNSEILSGVHIGRHTIVAAHAVVTKDLPPYCIAAGNPARIVKSYDPTTGKWIKP